MIDKTRHSESGFTLIELLIAIVVSGILLSAMATGFIATLRGTKDLHDRFVQSHDAQLLAAYFPSDVQSADPNLGVDQSAAAWAVCTGSAPAGTTNRLQLQWKETVGAVTTPFAVSYRTRQLVLTPAPDGTPRFEWQLVRYFCSGLTVKQEVVAHSLADPAVQAPLVTPNPVTGQKLSLTLYSAPATAGAYSYTFSGRMRTPVPPPLFPVVSSITRKTATPTAAGSVSWKVLFDRPVTGVDVSDFFVDVTTLSSVSTTPSGISPVSTTEYTLTANTGTGSGALGLNLVDNNSIKDTTAAQNPLGGSASGDGDYTGQSYNVDRAAPVVSSIARAGLQATSGPNVSWTVTFSEDVSGVDIADFTRVAAAGVSGGSTFTVTPVSAAVYTVTTGTVSGTGTLGLNLAPDNNSIKDDAGNALGGPAVGDGNFVGESYDISGAAPAAPSITDLQFVNKSGGTAGKIETGDRVVITFSAIMKVSSFCPGATPWAIDGNNQSRTAGNDVTVTVTNAGSNDVLTVSSATCSPFNFGSIDLGGNYTGSTETIIGSGSGAGNPPSTIEWDATAHTLTITFGKITGSPFGVVASSQPVYTASPSITDPSGQAIDNSPYQRPTAGIQF